MTLDGFDNLPEPPESAEAARCILGAVQLDNRVFRQCGMLSVEDFAVPFHRQVFAAMLELDENDRPIDPILIGEIIKRESGAKNSATVATVTNLTYGLPAFSSIAEYVREVRHASAVRKSIVKLAYLATALSQKKMSLKNFTQSLAAFESDLREDFAEETDSFKPLSAIMQREVLPTLEAYYRREVSEFLIPTGFPEIDEILGGGLYLSDFLAIVAPPKSAKSALALQLALNFANAGETVGVLSLEMSNLQNGLRFIAQQSFQSSLRDHGNLSAAVEANWLRPGIHKETFEQASKTAAELFAANLYLCQKPLEWSEVKAETRRLVREKNLRILIVDYWQLMETETSRGRNRAGDLADIAKGLKRLGQELNICVIALGQFNQEGLRKRDAGGELSTLYLEGSGELVKSANIVLTVDIKEGDLDYPTAPREGSLTFRPLRSGADARLPCLFWGKYLTVAINQ